MIIRHSGKSDREGGGISGMDWNMS